MFRPYLMHIVLFRINLPIYVLMTELTASVRRKHTAFKKCLEDPGNYVVPEHVFGVYESFWYQYLTTSFNLYTIALFGQHHANKEAPAVWNQFSPFAQHFFWV